MSQRISSVQAKVSCQSGFTLIEVLVVLMIVGMVSGLMFQVLEQAYRLQERFGMALFSVQQGQMATDWYRQSVQGLRPDYPDGHNQFRGSEKEFSGLTDNSLGNSYGAPTPITWKIRKTQPSGNTELVYLEGKQETSILSWHSSDVHFIYVDENQEPHDSWPLSRGSSKQLPKQIQLVTRDANDPVTIIATPMCTATPVPRLKDM